MILLFLLMTRMNSFLYSIGGSEKGAIDDLNDRFEDFSEIYAYTNKKRK